MAGTFSGNLQGTPSRPLEMLTSSKAVTASYALTASKFDTASVGGPSQSIFVSGGKPTPITASVGSKTQPIYVSGGKFTPADNIPTGKTGSWDNAAAWLAANSGSITGLTGSIPDVSATVVLLVDKSASWDDAATWVGANSASISSSVGKVSNLKGITFQTGAFTAKTYHPTGSQQTVNVPSTAAHVGAVSTASFNTYTSSAAAAMGEYLPKTGGTITGSLTITQNLTVQGTTVSIDAQNLNVKDKLILVASGSADRTAANGAGIAVPTASAGEGGAARIQYEGTGNRFTSSVNFAAPGFTGSLRGNVTGTASFATSASKAISASYADNATTASYALRSTTASWAIDANHAVSASEALHASSATTALTASYVVGGVTVTSASEAVHAISASHADEVQWSKVKNRPSFYSASFKTGSFSAKTYGPTSGSQTINIPTEIAHINGLSAVSTSVKEMVSNTASWNGMANTASAAYISASHALATASQAVKEAQSASYWKTEASKSAAQAATFASNASGSMQSTRDYATQASSSARSAAIYATSASVGAQSAAASASAAHNSANTAASSASKAANWAVSSSASANQAAYYAVSASASNTTIQQLAANVKQYYDNTTASAAQAATSATNAGNSATTATNAANRASASASVAKNWSTSASTYATNASASASLLYKNLGSATQPIYLTTGGPQLCDPYSSASVKNAVSASYATIAETVKGGATVTSASEAVHAISASHAVTASFALDHYVPSTTALTPTSSVGNSAARTYIKTLTLDKNKHVVGFTTGSETVTNTDTKVTAVGNHYAPTASTEIAASITGSAGAFATNTEYTVITGIKAKVDAKGHVTDIKYTAQKVKDTTIANTDRYVNTAAFASTGSSGSLGVKMTLTRAGSDTATVTATIPVANATAAGVVTAAQVNSWNGAATNSHTHSNKALLDSLTNAKTGSWDGKWTYNENTIKGVKVTSASRAVSAASADSATSASRAVSAASADNADTVDNLHASNFTRFYLSPLSGSGAPASEAQTWFANTMPAASAGIIYNEPGAEKTIIAGKSPGAYGHMLQLNYDDTYLRILRYYAGNWKSTDWEKISAGYADSAGSATSASRAVSAASADSATSASRAVSAASAGSATTAATASCLGVGANTSASVAAAINAKWTYNENTIKGVKVTSASRADSAASAGSATSASRAVSAASADSVAWGNVSDKPSTFAPSAHEHNYLVAIDGSGNDTLTAIQAAFDSVPKSKGVALRSMHGSHDMAFGWFLDGYGYESAYGGWFVSQYGNPHWVGVNNGTWIEGDFITTLNFGTQLAGYTSSWASAAANSHTHSNKSVLDGITSTKVSNWDTAYGWGNHASAGYAKQATANNFVFSGNEISLVPSGYSGSLYINYRTAGGLDGNITEYLFCAGKGDDLASLRAKTFYGTASLADKLSTETTGNVGQAVYFSNGTPALTDIGQVACPGTSSAAGSGGTVTLQPGVVTNLGSLTGNVTIALANGNSNVNGHCPVYCAVFTSSGGSITLPAEIDISENSVDIEDDGLKYEISIMNNLAIVVRAAS